MFLNLLFYLLPAIFIGVVGYIFLLIEKNNKYPKNYKRLFNENECIREASELMGKVKDISRIGYSKKKIPKDIDVIVIGSGIGGLTCAGLLSKVGKKVLVLEQHYIAGGCTHVFDDKGFEFDTGVHYIGNIEKRKKILDLITDPKIEWDQMGNLENGYCYDEINIEGKMYYLRAGEIMFLKEVEKHFPREIENVKRYLADVKKISQKGLFFLLKVVRYKWLSCLINFFVGGEFRKYINITAQEAIEQYTKNKDLQAFLLGQFGDYGKLPSQESFFVHCSIVNHYLNGAWFPKGGSGVIAKNIIPTIMRTGGRVLVRKAVKKILINDKKEAYGVEMINGDIIRAKTIITACGVPNTWKKLVEPQYVPKGVIEKIDKLGLSCSFVYAFIGLEGTPEELELRSSNIWHWPSKDYDKMIEDFENDPENAPIPMFIGFPCAKDSTWNKRYPGKSNAVILTMAKYSMFEKWAGTKMGKRGDEYEKFKEKFAERIVEEGLYHYYPKTKGKIKYLDMASPLTFNYYIGSQRGEAYGLENYPIRFQSDDWLRPYTNIKNMYLTGQDVTTLGLTGAMMAGVLTAHAVLGYGTVTDLISGRNLIEDIKHMEEVYENKED